MDTTLHDLTPLDDLLRSSSHVHVLRALFTAPGGMTFSARDIARRSSISHPRASAVLSSLRDQGLVHRRTRARLHLYEMNDDHVAVPALKRLFAWEREFGDELISYLKERLRTRRREVLAASLFGSAARGKMGTDSDIDLAIVTTREGAKALEPWLDTLREEVRGRFGRRLSPLVATSSTRSWPKRAPIWSQIRDEGVPLLQLTSSG